MDNLFVPSAKLRQRGAALIVLMCGLLLLTGVGVIGGQLAATVKQQSRNDVTESLARARQALLSYAVNYVDNYGHNTRGGVGRLPCPSLVPHGRPALRCGSNAIGFLPSVWNRSGKELEIDHREYFLDQNLWYAISADFRYNPSYNKLNPDTHGEYLSVNSRDDIVAVVISPGAALPGQLRNNVTFNPSLYLEGDNADFDRLFEIDHAGNDQVVFISRDELMPLIERRVLGFVRDWLIEYYAAYGHYPFAARLGDPLAACEQGLTVGVVSMTRGNCVQEAFGELFGANIPKGRQINQTWFGNYDWAEFIFYQVDPSCVPTSSEPCMGPTPVQSQLQVDGSPAEFLLISTGAGITSAHLGQMQDRLNHPADLSSYLDTSELVNAGSVYDFAHLSSVQASNDQYLVMR
jgi:hypothetical protein